MLIINIYLLIMLLIRLLELIIRLKEMELLLSVNLDIIRVIFFRFKLLLKGYGLEKLFILGLFLVGRFWILEVGNLGRIMMFVNGPLMVKQVSPGS